jgi:hypothetical protein
LAGTSLADRRTRAALVLKARRGVHDPTTPSDQDAAAKSSARHDLANLAPPESDTTAVDFSRSAGSKPSSGRSRTVAFGVAILAGALTGLAVYAFRDPAQTAPSASGSALAAAAPSGSSSETPTVTAVDASAKPITTITLKADAPIASVTIGGRTVVIAAPREEVAIELPPDLARPAVLDVASSTRRQVQVTVEADASTVDVTFAGTAARPTTGGNAGRVPAGGARPTGTGAKKGSTKGPKLGDYPGK